MATPELGRLYQGVAKESAAFRLMKQMGWEEGQGLGKHKQGISTHVRVAKKFDTTGVGLAEARKDASNWTVNTAIFDSILKNLNIKAQEKNNPDHAGSADEEDSPKPPEESAAAVKKTARPQGRYKRREAGKCVKSYSESDLSAILGVAPPPAVTVPTAAAEAPRKRTPEPGSESNGAGEPQGKKRKDKEKKRTRGASLQGPSNERCEVRGDAKGAGADTEGAAGVSKKRKKATAQCQEPPVSSDPEQQPAGAEEGEKEEESKKAGVKSSKAKKLKASKSESALVVIGASADFSPQPLPADWWGHRVGFVRGEMLGSASRAKEAEKEAGFSEADQEGLYHLVNNTATSGKKGLGISSQPKKVAGARWKGQKVTFDDLAQDSADEDDKSDEAREAGERAEDGEADASECPSSGEKSGAGAEKDGADQVSVKAGKKRRRGCGREAKHDDATEGGVPVEEGSGKQVRWKTIIRSLLKQEPDGLEVLKLQSMAVDEAVQQLGPSAADRANLEKILQKKWKKLGGTCFVQQGKLIRLRVEAAA